MAVARKQKNAAPKDSAESAAGNHRGDAPAHPVEKGGRKEERKRGKKINGLPQRARTHCPEHGKHKERPAMKALSFAP